MTAREFLTYTMSELNKQESPPLLLEDYNYFINKTIFEYIKDVSSYTDMTQELSDSLRVLSGTAYLDQFTKKTGFGIQSEVYITELPKDYLRIYNCIAEIKVLKPTSCYSFGELLYIPVKRVTADKFASVIKNHYLKPSYKNPYYYIHSDTAYTLDSLKDKTKEAGSQIGNPSDVSFEIRCGDKAGDFQLMKVAVDYLKCPRFIKLTQAQIDSEEDTSQVMEFPDSVCFDIIKKLTLTLLENAGDPRINTNPVVNKTGNIGMPDGFISNK